MLSIITPVWNKKEITSQFIQCLLRYLKDNELIIVNNGSTDGTKDVIKFFQNYSKNIYYVELSENVGFGAANNIGAEFARGDRLLFLSNDVMAEGDFITPILENLNDSVLVGARLIDFNTGWNSFNELDKPISYLEGFCVGMTKNVYKSLKWDERYFSDYEDMSLSLEAVNMGLGLVGLKLPLNHIGGQTAQQLEGGRLKMTLESQKKFCEKWNLTIK